MNRRQFMTLLLMASATTRLAGCQRPKKSTQSETVVVIGAGMAGIAAARNLQDAGHTVIVLEGRDRIGGRVWTSRQWADAPADMGASWIHGTEGNPLTAIADEVDAPRQVTDYNSGVLYDVAGNLQPDRAWDQIARLSTQVSQVLEEAKQSGNDRSVEAAIKAWIDRTTLSEIERRRLEFAVHDWLEQDWAADMSELSTHYFDEGEPSEGDEVIFPEGYDALIDHLATDLDIRLNEIVTHVDYSGAAGVTIAASSGTFKADRVIVTLPIGVLKAGTVTFEPALPTPKQAAIETLGAGVLNKVYLQFADAFWQRQTHWISYISEPKGEFTTWFNLYQYTGEPILVAFNAGDFGRKIEAFTDDQIVDQAMQTLRRLYGETIPNPTDVQITRWLRDPFARCSYSFPTVGMTDETRADLAAPIDNRVFFAGEATHSGYPATVHGAYLSGQRAAKQLQQIGSTIAT